MSEAGSGSAVAPAVSDLSEGDDITLTCDAVTTGGQQPRVKWSKQVPCDAAKCSYNYLEVLN